MRSLRQEVEEIRSTCEDAGAQDADWHWWVDSTHTLLDYIEELEKGQEEYRKMEERAMKQWHNLTEGLPSSILDDPDRLALFIRERESLDRQEAVIANCPGYERGTSIACSNCGMAHGDTEAVLDRDLSEQEP